MNLARQLIVPKSRRKIHKIKIETIEEIDYPVFTPNAGGQQAFFDLIPSDKVYEDEIKYLYLRGGNGSGKSTCGSKFANDRTLLDPHARGLITANDYGQLATSTLVQFAETCQKFGYKLELIEGDHKVLPGNDPEITARQIAQRKACFLNNAFIYVLSARIFKGGTEKASQSGRGLSVRWMWFDEPAYAEESTFNAVKTRLGRGPGFMPAIAVLTGTINVYNPFNWCYDYFDSPKRDEETNKLFKSIVVPTSQNAHNLDPDYERTMSAGWTQELIDIELNAIYASSKTNLVVPYFNRSKHLVSDCEVIPRYQLHVSLDFNHHPACAIAGQYLPDCEELIIQKEWYLENSNTFELAEEIAQWFLEARGLYQARSGIIHTFQKDLYQLQVHGDATGKQKTANSRLTNWQIVLGTLEKHRITYRKRYRLSNPNVKDTVNSLNCSFKTDKIFVDDDCIELIKDFEMLKWNDQGEIDKKTDKMRSHLLDCARYMVNDVMPYRKAATYFDRHYNMIEPKGILT